MLEDPRMAIRREARYDIPMFTSLPTHLGPALTFIGFYGRQEKRACF